MLLSSNGLRRWDSLYLSKAKAHWQRLTERKRKE
jgi:hypothetical protein